MLGQTSFPQAKASLPFQLDTDRAALAGDVASPNNCRFLWTGFGLAVIMLIGFSTCAFFRLASHEPAESSHHGAAVLAFSPSLLSVPAGIRPVIKDMHNKVTRQQALHHGQGKTSGSLRRSSLAMSAVLHRHSAGGSQSAVLDRPAPPLQRQHAPPPTPPPPSPPTPPPGGGGSGGEGGAVLKRYTPAEAVMILDAWIARVQVYCLSDQFDDPEGLAAVHRATLQQLESFRAFALSPPSAAAIDGLSLQQKISYGHEGKLIYGLYSIQDIEEAASEVTADHNVLAMAAGETTSDITNAEPDLGGTLHIKHISVNPKDLAPCDFGRPAMQQALGVAAHMREKTLVIDTDSGDSC